MKPPAEPPLPSPPDVKPKLEEMDDISMVMFKAWDSVLQYGAITITPPEGWRTPRLRLSNDSTFNARIQCLPPDPEHAQQPGSSASHAQKQRKQIKFSYEDELVNVGEYRNKADEFTARASRMVFALNGVAPGSEQNQNPFDSVDFAEAEFWKAIANGFGGKPIKVSYGVDVEAEGVYAKDENPATSGDRSGGRESTDLAEAATLAQQMGPESIAEHADGKEAVVAANKASGENSPSMPMNSSVVVPQQNLVQPVLQASSRSHGDAMQPPQTPSGTGETLNSEALQPTLAKADGVLGPSTNLLQPADSQPNQNQLNKFEGNLPLANLVEHRGASGKHIQTEHATETVPQGNRGHGQPAQLPSTPMSNIPPQVAPLSDIHQSGGVGQVGIAQDGPSKFRQLGHPVEDMAQKTHEGRAEVQVRQLQEDLTPSNLVEGVQGSHANGPLGQISSGSVNYSNLRHGTPSAQNKTDNSNGSDPLNPSAFHAAGYMANQVPEASMGASPLHRDGQMGGHSTQANVNSGSFPQNENSLGAQAQSSQMHGVTAAQNYSMQASGGRSYQDDVVGLSNKAQGVLETHQQSTLPNRGQPSGNYLPSMKVHESHAQGSRAHGAGRHQFGSEATFGAGNPMRVPPNAPEYNQRLNESTRNDFNHQANNINITGHVPFARQRLPSTSGSVPPGPQPLPGIRSYPPYQQVQMPSVNVQQPGSSRFPKPGSHLNHVYGMRTSQNVGHAVNAQMPQAYPSNAANSMSYSPMPGISSHAVTFPAMEIANSGRPLTAAMPTGGPMSSDGGRHGNYIPNMVSSSSGLGQSRITLPGLRSPPYGQLRPIEQITRDPLPGERVFSGEILPAPVMPRNVAGVPGHGPPRQLYSNPQIPSMVQPGSIGQVHGLQSSAKQQVHTGIMPNYNSGTTGSFLAQAAEPRVGQSMSGYPYALPARSNIPSSGPLPPSTVQEHSMSIAAANSSSADGRIGSFVPNAAENNGVSSRGIDNPYTISRAATDPNMPTTSAMAFPANHIVSHQSDFNGITSVAAGPGIQHPHVGISGTPSPPPANVNGPYLGPLNNGNANPGHVNPDPSSMLQGGQVSSGARRVQHVNPARPSVSHKDDEEVLDGGDGGQDVTMKAKRLRDSPDNVSKVAQGSGAPEVKRRPRAEPKSHVGNINDHGLLRFLSMRPGINRSMFYIGQLFTRFCWHTEDAFLNSVSYLHHGSAPKVWYVIPPEYADYVAEYVEKEVYAESLVEGMAHAGTALLMGKTTMIDPWSLRKHGIPVYRIVHRPGTFVVTAPRGYHAGFNCGFNVAEAVNYAGTNWLPFGRIASSIYRTLKRHLNVPQEQLMYCAASALKNEVERVGIAEVKKNKRSVDSAKILAVELGMLIREGEAAIAKYAKSSGCRVMHVSEAKSSVVSTELDTRLLMGCFCGYCAHMGFFYAAVCGSCTKNEDARCQYHFGKGKKLCSKPGHKVVVIRRHRALFLLDLLEVLEKVAGIRVSPETMLKRYKFLRSWDTPLKTSGIRFQLPLAEAMREEETDERVRELKKMRRLKLRQDKEKARQEKSKHGKAKQEKTGKKRGRKSKQSPGKAKSDNEDPAREEPSPKRHKGDRDEGGPSQGAGEPNAPTAA